MRDEILLLDNVTKTIKGRQIIKEISFSMKQGEVMGFLGPNGAGKSTTIRMIVGLSKPTSGKIDICGYSITKNYVKAMSNVGCIIEGPDLYNYMSGIDNLKMLASMSRDVTEKDIINVVDLVGLKNRIKDKVSTYSLGMKQRLGIAQALMHNPKLLILDEPTNGLDPSGISELRNLVKLLASEKNISVLVSSHIISEIELMCDKVTIIKNGETVLKSADVDKLLNNQGVFWVLSDNEKGRKILEKNWKVKGNVVEERLEANVSLEKLQEINSCFVERGLMIKYVDNKNKTLEDLFLNLTEGNQII
ncbi:ABC transporter ATP-binding protein [Clostridium autoethanogenum]|uniref:ABC transporter ATP-binding protein n=1 Tax=Clostridium autoethanogenum DSM 10061 TaxID=1341692 RepID=A0ABN4BLB2_9CLOT|nr:ABC transporter ATP-binding protein [Clostridium autoethanogenum]AGY78143.1 ABC transporter ATP-binding protein [Clostridium autoethanogenum DSM 10061]ALU38276.1 ABC-type transporter ATPase component [Clostridium autoethanogenum DSM 10061]OVY51039.1 putative ABC transporter ATP-binding protein YxlF [Clostridium autoethanogenum]